MNTITLIKKRLSILSVKDSLQPTNRALRRLGNRIPSAPQPLLLEKQKYKLSCKKPSDVCPAGTNAAMLLMPKITTLSPTFAKPDVSRSLFVHRKKVNGLNKNKLQTMKQLLKVIRYVFSEECPIDVKSQVISHGLAILVSVVALVVSLFGLVFCLTL